jgi:hypothetical protein
MGIFCAGVAGADEASGPGLIVIVVGFCVRIITLRTGPQLEWGFDPELRPMFTIVLCGGWTKNPAEFVWYEKLLCPETMMLRLG